MRGHIGITFNDSEGRNIVNIEYECGCSYNHYLYDLSNHTSTFTSTCKVHSKFIDALFDIGKDVMDGDKE